MWHLRAHERYVKPAITAASVALALPAEGGRNWEPLLERHGLTMWDLELVLRMHQLQAIQYFNSEDELSSEEKEEYADLLVTNYACVSKRDPSHPALPLPSDAMLTGNASC
ncbi:g4727 [Coccomyxa elongata]